MYNDGDEFTRLDDSALLSWRAKTRSELARLTPGSRAYAALLARYDQSTTEVNERARVAWSRSK